MSRSDGRTKVAVLFNIIAPAKVPVYSGLAAHFDLLLLHGGMESNRDSWSAPERKISGAQIKQVWSWQLELRKMSGKIRDRRHLHITPGFILHLFRFRPDVVVTNEMGFRTLQALIYGTLDRWSASCDALYGVAVGREVVQLRADFNRILVEPGNSSRSNCANSKFG